ncbi:hypothetical protein [Microbacterium sp. SORGH_AS_0421]|uniref:hypothetical protein n=1 Tax=Microbacterium sp. SORGH_AS_0421 TaxID=3041768 RepID=UPI00278F4C7A|nr:hypothetical protein [Microbacterium sp. SORGH_AS_0421]MDQ1178519.1 hypothetical protein [Microbacterium sp. SORGH_AS_0421]
MTSIDDDDELATLRRRAYAPGADISSDPAALRRLMELEQREAVVEDAADRVPETPHAPAEDEREPQAPPRRRMPRLRRSSVIVLSAAVLVVVCAATAIIVVQRTQTDPLQAGATQVARLAADPSFDVPSVLTPGVSSGTTGYAEYEGFRVATYASFDTGDDAAKCMTVWQPDLLDISGGGFSYDGRFFLTSCGAGVFPANTMLHLSEDSAEIRATDLPAGTSLHFVYDKTNDEIVVFRG